MRGELSFLEIIIYAFIIVYGIATIVLTFKLLAFCDKFDEFIKIVRYKARVKEVFGKIVPINEDGTVIPKEERE